MVPSLVPMMSRNTEVKYLYGYCVVAEGEDRVWTHPTEVYKNKGFFSNNGLDPLDNNKATNPAINVGPLSAHQQSAI